MTTPAAPRSAGLGWPDHGAMDPDGPGPRTAPDGADVDQRSPLSAPRVPVALGWSVAALPPFRRGEGAPLHPDGA